MAAKNDAPNDTAGGINLSSEQFERLLSRIGSSDGGDPIVQRLALAIEGFASAQARQADATERTVMRSNAQHPHKSVFDHPEGAIAHPKDKLTAKTIFEGVVQNEEQLTPVEIAMFNRIQSAKTARDGKWIATYKPSLAGSQPELSIDLGVHGSFEKAAGLPPLPAILAELQGGADATDVAKLFAEIERLKSEVSTFAQSEASKSEPVTVGV